MGFFIACVNFVGVLVEVNLLAFVIPSVCGTRALNVRFIGYLALNIPNIFEEEASECEVDHTPPVNGLETILCIDTLLPPAPSTTARILW